MKLYVWAAVVVKWTKHLSKFIEMYSPKSPIKHLILGARDLVEVAASGLFGSLHLQEAAFLPPVGEPRLEPQHSQHDASAVVPPPCEWGCLEDETIRLLSRTHLELRSYDMQPAVIESLSACTSQGGTDILKRELGDFLSSWLHWPAVEFLLQLTGNNKESCFKYHRVSLLLPSFARFSV